MSNNQYIYGNQIISGSLIAPSITGSLQGTASFSITASYFSGSIANAIYSETASYVNPLNQNVIITGSVANGFNVYATGPYSHAEGWDTEAFAQYSHTEGRGTEAFGLAAHAEGYASEASGSYSHAEGIGTLSSGSGAHAEGSGTYATGYASHAEGHSEGGEAGNLIASGPYSHAEGVSTRAQATGSHTEGYYTIAIGSGAHAEGYSTQANGLFSHAEGVSTRAYGYASHAEGYLAIASGSYSHAEGHGTIASGSYSHAEGYYTVASGSYQHVQGQFNLSSSADSAFIIGNGSSDGSRSNLVFASGSTFQVTGSVIATAGFTGSFSGSFTGTATSASITSDLSNNGYIGGSTNGTQVITFSSSSMGATTSSLGTLISSVENNNGINIAYTIRTDIAGIHSDGSFGNYIGGTLTSTWYRASSGELTLAGSITQIKNSTFSSPSPEFTHRVDYSILGPTYKINVVATGKSGDTTNVISWKATSYIVTSPSVTI